MKRPTLSRASLLVALAVVGAAGIVAGQAARAVKPQPAAAPMVSAARALVKTLDATQTQKLMFPFETEERQTWFFTPVPRKGLPLKEMTEAQRHAGLALLRAGLSEKGYGTAEAVRSLEEILKVTDKPGGPVRDHELYFFSIFGEPSDTGTWGWRYEGHHLSQNWTIVRGQAIATSPQFFGANPAEVREGPRKGTRVLGAREDLARALMDSLSEAQKQAAIVSEKAPADMLTGNTRQAAIQEDKGVAAGSLRPPQQALLLAIIDEYARANAPALAEERLARMRNAGFSNIKFAWMGSTERGQGHYYRVQGPTFLIEYDNTQTSANHIHSVWRDFKGDFGLDLLARHYRQDPEHVAQQQP